MRTAGVNEPTSAPRVAPRDAALQSIAALDGDGPVWQQIRRVLARPILSGEWAPGTRIPPELTLTKRFRTSRMTVGKAIQSLAKEGFVERKRKTGTVVADRAQERPVFEIWDVADLVAQAGGTSSYKLLVCMKLKQAPVKRGLVSI